MLSRKETEKALQEFVDSIVEESRENLSAKGINASGDLSKSIKGNVKASDNSIEVTIEAENYLKFVDRGVKGVKSGSSLSNYAFKSKGGKNGLKGMPPPNKLTTYMKRRTGKFLGKDRKQIGFATAVSVFYYGIKPTEFFTTPFEKAFKRLPEELVKAYALDIESFIEFTLKK
jgi:hypothetical protein